MEHGIFSAEQGIIFARARIAMDWHNASTLPINWRGVGTTDPELALGGSGGRRHEVDLISAS
jgi:hypothetical protein